jgi:hypothetical protein
MRLALAAELYQRFWEKGSQLWATISPKAYP